jgi:hypothetical protein
LANLWVDGFEGYGSFGVGTGYMLQGGGEHTTTGGRGGGSRLEGGASRVFFGPFDNPAGRTLFVGSARLNGESIAFQNNASQNLAFIFTNGLGQLVVQLNGSTVATITPPMRLLGAWRYFEHQVKVIDATHVAYECRVDEVVISPLTTYTVPSITNTTIAVIDYEAGSVGDDWYVNDDTGAAPDNTYWGDTRMFILSPDGDDSVTWTPSSGANNYSRVNEQATDVTTYVQTGTVGNQDLYTYANTGLPAGTVIRTLAVMTVAQRLSDAGPRVLKAVLKSGATSVQGPAHQLSDTPYIVQFRNPVDPNTGLAWTVANADAVKAGQILIS